MFGRRVMCVPSADFHFKPQVYHDNVCCFVHRDRLVEGFGIVTDLLRALRAVLLRAWCGLVSR